MSKEKGRKVGQAIKAIRIAAAIPFTVLASEGKIDNDTLTANAAVFSVWTQNWRGKTGDIVQDEGRLFKSLQDVKNNGQNRKPSENPSRWEEIVKEG